MSCKVEPKEYSYKDNSVIRTVSEGNNCIRYDQGDNNGDPVDTTQYIHCHGSNLLTDSDTGPSQYDGSRTPLYIWTSSKAQQLLFVLPTTTNLAMITLHYYSGYYQGSHKAGLPRLRLFAVPDDFDVWDASIANSRFSVVVSMMSPEEQRPARRRSVSISFNSNTMKVLIVKIGSDFHFAVSEVEFFTCTSKCGYISVSSMHNVGISIQ